MLYYIFQKKALKRPSFPLLIQLGDGESRHTRSTSVVSLRFRRISHVHFRHHLLIYDEDMNLKQYWLFLHCIDWKIVTLDEHENDLANWNPRARHTYTIKHWQYLKWNRFLFAQTFFFFSFSEFKCCCFCKLIGVSNLNVYRFAFHCFRIVFSL